MSRIIVSAGDSHTSFSTDGSPLILDFLRDHGYAVSADCAGNGTCGKCTVTIRINSQDQQVLSCQQRITEGMEILLENADTFCDIPVIPSDITAIPSDITAVPSDIIAESPAVVENQAANEDDSASQDYAAAVDLGTTTIAVSLIDRKTGQCPGSLTELNRQTSYGSDVISRVQYTSQHEDGLGRLSQIASGQIMDMISRLCRSCHIDTREISQISVSGNTIMQHILAGLDPSGIAVAPYTPVTLFQDKETYLLQIPGTDSAIHNRRMPESSIDMHLSPCISGYIGGDIVAGLLGSELYKKDEHSLFIDIGTNGEMALGGKDGFICCSVATGPAFEGAEISCGMVARAGAIHHFRWENASLHMDVIGDGAPTGICGSGLIDLIAILLRLGVIDESGYLNPPEDLDYMPRGLTGILEEDEDGNGIIRLSDKVFFTAGDVRKIQLAKAAVSAGIDVLTETSGLSLQEISHLYLAGNFGEHLDAENAARIGMIPQALKDKIICLGNASLKGSMLAATEGHAYDIMKEICRKAQYIELSGNKDFTEAFIDAMAFEEE